MRLTRSLLSGFPNEVDFTFNVITVMSFKSPSGFPLTEVGSKSIAPTSHFLHTPPPPLSLIPSPPLPKTQVPQLLDLMLSHVAVFPSHDHYGMSMAALCMLEAVSSNGRWSQFRGGGGGGGGVEIVLSTNIHTESG